MASSPGGNRKPKTTDAPKRSFVTRARDGIRKAAGAVGRFFGGGRRTA